MPPRHSSATARDRVVLLIAASLLRVVRSLGGPRTGAGGAARRTCSLGEQCAPLSGTRFLEIVLATVVGGVWWPVATSEVGCLAEVGTPLGEPLRRGVPSGLVKKLTSSR